MDTTDPDPQHCFAAHIPPPPHRTSFPTVSPNWAVAARLWYDTSYRAVPVMFGVPQYGNRTKLRMTNIDCECTVICGGRLDCLELVAVSSVVDSHHQNADPDLAFYFDADPNLTFYFDIDLYPTFHIDAEPLA
jgi:hypothetical protein